MDTKQISKLRRAVAKAKQGEAGRIRYPESLKSLVVDMLRQGHGPTELSNLIGIGVSTLFNWSQLPDARDNFRSLKVAKTSVAAECDLKLTLPNGLRVEGPATVATLRLLLEWLK